MDPVCPNLSIVIPVQFIEPKSEFELSMDDSPTKRKRMQVRDRSNRTSEIMKRNALIRSRNAQAIAAQAASVIFELPVVDIGNLSEIEEPKLLCEVPMIIVDNSDCDVDSIESIRRIFGLYSDNMSFPLTSAELLAINHVKASPFPLYEECRVNKLPLMCSVLAEFGEIMDLGDGLNSEQRCAATELKMAYHTRKFEINNMTFSVSKCDSCGCLKQKQGVFMVPPVDPNARVNGNTKHIWKLLSPPSEAGKFAFFTDNEVRRRDPNGQLVIKVALCKSCTNDLSKNAKKQPKFSERSG